MVDFRWFYDKQVRDAVKALDDAREQLNSYSEHQKARNDDTESPEFHRLNNNVHKAKDNLRRARP